MSLSDFGIMIKLLVAYKLNDSFLQEGLCLYKTLLFISNTFRCLSKVQHLHFFQLTQETRVGSCEKQVC